MHSVSTTVLQNHNKQPNLKMKFLIAFAALIAVCAALPAAIQVSPDGGAQILRDSRSNDGLNGYQFDFETSNGISRQEHGVLKPVGETGVIVVDGSASWTSPEGLPIALKFVADENGYQPIV